MKVIEDFILADNPPELTAVAGALPMLIEDLTMPLSDRYFNCIRQNFGDGAIS